MSVQMLKKKSTTTREVLNLAIANSGCILVTATTQKYCENLEKSLIQVGIPKEDIHRFDGIDILPSMKRRGFPAIPIRWLDCWFSCFCDNKFKISSWIFPCNYMEKSNWRF
jgi:hypothetical protein